MFSSNSGGQHYSPRMMVQKPEIGQKKSSKGLKQSVEAVDMDDPSCISFSENIDESPNRQVAGLG